MVSRGDSLNNPTTVSLTVKVTIFDVSETVVGLCKLTTYTPCLYNTPHEFLYPPTLNLSQSEEVPGTRISDTISHIP